MRHDPPKPQAIDDMTGFKVDHCRLKRQWDGALTVNPDKRNPQDFVRARPERPALQNPRPEMADTFLAEPIQTEDSLPIVGGGGDMLFTEGTLNGEGL